jgi:hypothetical protein
VDWRARELLEEAIKARQTGRLTREALGALRRRLRAATSPAELQTIATEIAGTG